MFEPLSFIMGAMMYATVSLGFEYYSLSKKLQLYKETWGGEE